MKNNIHNKFEQNFPQPEYEYGVKTAAIALSLGKTCMEFTGIERVPRYANGERENDAEHSFMLSLVAPELVEALDLPLDAGLVARYASVHDLIELKTGDVPTLLVTDDQQLQKELNEQAALRALVQELPPNTARLLARYEAQQDPESRFVRYVDKLLPIVIDILRAGTRVMQQDYHITTAEQLHECHQALHTRIVAKFGNEFPALDLAHELLIELFEQKFNNMQEIGLM